MGRHHAPGRAADRGRVAVLGLLMTVLVAAGCRSSSAEAPLQFSVSGLTELSGGTLDGDYFGGVSPQITFTATSSDPSRTVAVILELDPTGSGVSTWSQAGVTFNGQIGATRVVATGKGTATLVLSGTTAVIATTRGQVIADDGAHTFTQGWEIRFFLPVVTIAKRVTRDVDQDGFVDAVDLVYDGPLNFDFSNFFAVVFGYDLATPTPFIPHPTDADTVRIRVNERLTPDTDATPDVEVLVSTSLTDSTGVIPTTDDGGVPQPTTDGAAPVLRKARASDEAVPGDGVDAGDTVTLTFSEALVPVVVDAASVDGVFTPTNGALTKTWLDASGALGGPVTFAGTDVVLTLGDTGGPPTVLVGDFVTASGGSGLIVDAAANEATGTRPITGSFDPRATIVNRFTRDQDNNGQLDAIEIIYFLPLDDATLTGYTVTVAGYTITTITSGATPNDERLLVGLAELTTPDTGALPAVEVTSSGSLTSTAATGSRPAVADTQPVAPTDGAAPVLLSATGFEAAPNLAGKDAGDFVWLKFSERLGSFTLDASNIDAALPVNAVAGLRTWLDGGGGLGAVSVIDDTISVAFSEDLAFGLSPIAIGDVVTAASVPVVDPAGLIALGTATLGGTFNPTLEILTRRTRDRTGNGQIDAIELEFNQAVNDDFTGGLTVTVSGYVVSGFSTGGTPLDAFIDVQLTEQGAPDSGVTPDVQLTVVGNLRDGDTGTLLPPVDPSPVTSADGAGPIALTALATDGANAVIGIDADDSVTVTFSEAISPTTLTALQVDAAYDVSPHSWLDGSGAYGGIVYAGLTATIALSITGGPPTVQVGDAIALGALVTDLAGNSGVGSIAITGQFSPPVLPVTRVTVDANKNGYLDAIDIQYDAALSDDFTGATATVSGGYVVRAITTGRFANDDVLRIEFLEGSAPDTSALPTVQLTSAGNLKDVTGAALVQADAAPVPALDAAPPIIVAAVAQDAKTPPVVGADAGDTVFLAFSESVTGTLTSTNIDEALALTDDHLWVDGAGVTQATFVSPNLLKITLSSGTAPPTVSIGDRILPDGVTITEQTAGALPLADMAPAARITGTFGEGASGDFWATRVPLPYALSDMSVVDDGESAFLVGGLASGVPVASAFFYNPAIGRVLPLPSIPEARARAASVLIGSEWWVIGGTDGTTDLNTVYIYHLDQSTWTLGPALPSPHAGGAAVRLGETIYLVGGSGAAHGLSITPGASTWATLPAPPIDRRGGALIGQQGELYYFGGRDTGFAPQPDALRYDPQLAQWSLIPPLPRALTELGAMAIDDRVILLGGTDSAGGPSDQVLSYDLTADSYTEIDSLPQPLSGVHQSVAALAGGVYVFGGNDGTSETDRVSSYHPGRGEFRWSWLIDPGNSLGTPQPRAGAGVVAWGRRVLVIGGDDLTGAPTNTVLQFDPETYAWTLRQPMPVALSEMAVVEFNGLVYVFGGRSSSGATTTVLRFDPAENVWVTLGTLSVPWMQGRAVVFGGAIHLLGGSDGITPLVLHDVFTPSTGLFAPDISLLEPRARFAAAVVAGVLVIAGGNGPAPLATTRAFDGSSWSALPPLMQPRGGTNGVVFDGRFWVVGGEAVPDERRTVTFDATTLTWRPGPSLPDAIADLGLAVVGRALYRFGGREGGQALQDFQVLGHHTQNWRWDADGLTPLTQVAGAALDNELFVAGGSDGVSPVATASRYTTGSGWSAIPNLPAARTQAIGGAADGRFWVIGGIDAAGSTRAETYRFEPVTESWAVGPALPAPRHDASAATIFGFLFVLGGSDGNSDTRTTYAITGGTVIQLNDMNLAHTGGQAASALDKVYVFGGNPNPRSVEVLDLGTASWRRLGNMPHQHIDGTAVNLNGLIYVIGGTDSLGGRVTYVDRFDPVSETWSQSFSLPRAVNGMAAGVIDGELVTAYGVSNTEPLGSAATLIGTVLRRTNRDAVTPEYWRQVGPALILNHVGGGITASVGNEQIVVVGADAGLSGAQRATVLDPETETLSLGSFAGVDLGHAALAPTPGASGKILAINGGGALQATREYDTGGDTWTTLPVAGAPLGTDDSAAVALPASGDVLMAGGVVGAAPVVDTFRYKPSLLAWVTAAPLPLPRARGALTAIDGQAVYLGGDDGLLPKSSVYVYDPALNTWRTDLVASLPVARTDIGAGTVSESVVVVGGTSALGNVAKECYFYDFDNRQWIPTADVVDPTQRGGHSVVSVNGRLYRLVNAANTRLEMFVPPEQWLRVAAATPPAPEAKAFGVADWTGSEMLWFGGEGVSSGSKDLQRFNPSTGLWVTAKTGVITPRRRLLPAHCYTGTEFIVWGGLHSALGFLSDGERYNLLTDAWTALPSAPLAARHAPMVWMNGKALVWGGNNDTQVFGDGATYDPAANTWTLVSPATLSGRSQHVMVFTGKEAFVWGGRTATGTVLGNGARYDADVGTWSAVAMGNAPSARHSAFSVWTGQEVIVWGGVTDDALGSLTNTGARYDPVLNAWTTMSIVDGPPALSAPETGGMTQYPTAFWTGTEMVIAAAFDSTGKPASAMWAYSPNLNRWRRLGVYSWPKLEGMATVFTGEELITVGGRPSAGTGGATPVLTGARTPIKPQLDNAWDATDDLAIDAPTARQRLHAVWTGFGAFLWGGLDAGGNTVKDGAMYDPFQDAWTPTTSSGSATRRSDGIAVWTGSEVVVWGGDDKGTVLDVGSRYSPLSDAWTAMATPPAGFAARKNASAVWADGLVVIFGGIDGGGGFLDSVATYDPRTDTWVDLSGASGAPSPRSAPAMVSLGSGKVLVFGGLSALGPEPTGFILDLTAALPSNRWSAINVVGAPPVADMQWAWAGTELLVFSSGPGGGLYAYNAKTDVWRACSGVGAPPAQTTGGAMFAHGIWTGAEFLMLAGEDDATPGQPVSGRFAYNPVRDTWRQLPQAPIDPAAPPFRLNGSQLWAGGGALLWGGDNGAGAVQAGGRYH